MNIAKPNSEAVMNRAFGKKVTIAARLDKSHLIMDQYLKDKTALQTKISMIPALIDRSVGCG